MMKVYVVRHGETEWNADGDRYCGRTDIGLSARGEQQAQRLAQALQPVPFAAVYNSPLLRARQTAGAIAAQLGIEAQEDERLLEIDFGAWEGLYKEQLLAEETRDLWDAWLADPLTACAGGNGENAQAVYERWEAFFREKEAMYGGKQILVVGHNTAIRLFIAGSLGMPLRNYRQLVQANTGISRFERQDGVCKWLCLNDTAHLSD